MLRHQMRNVHGNARIELEMHDINPIRDLLFPAQVFAQRQDRCEITMRTRRHQISHAMPGPDERPSQIPYHAFGAAIGEHRNRAAINDEYMHQGFLVSVAS
ncbi:hypothetical protein D3C81_1791800 [compost metagenome]